jgi:hypothetical protein
MRRMRRGEKGKNMQCCPAPGAHESFLQFMDCMAYRNGEVWGYLGMRLERCGSFKPCRNLGLLKSHDVLHFFSIWVVLPACSDARPAPGTCRRRASRAEATSSLPSPESDEGRTISESACLANMMYRVENGSGCAAS